MDDCAALLRVAAEAAGASDTFSYRERSIDPFAAPERLTVAEAFHRFAGIDLLATLAEHGTGSRRACAVRQRASASRPRTTTRGATCSAACWWRRSSRASATAAPPCSRSIPACQAALARPKPSDPRVAERFELYACGVELANAFGELTDPAEQRRRLEAEMAEKQRIYGERYPIDEDFLAALAHMPPASGAALGFDRLVMLATGARHIEQVLWTPVAEPAM